MSKIYKNNEKNLDNCKELQLYWYLKKELIAKIKPTCTWDEYETAVEPIGEYLLKIVNKEDKIEVPENLDTILKEIQNSLNRANKILSDIKNGIRSIKYE